MWIINKWDELMVRLDTQNDEETESFMFKTYSYVLQISLMSFKMERKYRPWFFLYLILFFCIFIFNIVTLIVTLIHFSRYNFIIFSYAIHLSLLFLMVPIFIVTFLMKGKRVNYVHRIMMEGFYDYQEPIPKEVEELRVEISRKLKFFSFFVPLIVAVTGLTLLVANKVDDDYGSFDFDSIANVSSIHHPFRFAIYPFPVNSGFLYFFTYGLFMFSTVNFALSAGSFGYVVINIGYGIILQLKLLTLYLDNIEKRAINMIQTLYDIEIVSLEKLYALPEFSKCYNICLRKTFVHHQMIIRCFNSFNDIISALLFTYNVVGTIVIALSLLLTRKFSELPGTSSLSILLCIAEVGSMFVISHLGQTITDLSSDLRFKMYSTKWYYCNASTKRSLMIFQARTLRPLTIKAGGLIPINMVFFATVMNSAYSYYNLVNAFNVDMNQS